MCRKYIEQDFKWNDISLVATATCDHMYYASGLLLFSFKAFFNDLIQIVD